MRKFTKHPRVPVTASKAEKWYICPECHNKTVVPMYPDNTPLVDEGEVFICNECGAEFEAHPLYNGEVKFTLPFGEYVQRHGPGGPDDLTDDDYDYWYSRWEAYVDSVKRRVTSAKTIKASIKKPMSFEEYCQATWGLSSSKLTSDDKKKAEEEYHRVTKQPVDSAEETTRKQDRRLSPTSVRYKGYLIVLDRGGDGYNIYDKHRELEDAGYPSVESAKKCVDEIIREENGGIKAAEEADVDEYEDDIQEISQEFTSENTSINSGKLPAIFKMIHLAPGTINIDYGGGKFDNVAEYLAPMDVVNLVYDPYNRTPEHNKEVLRTIRNAGGADSATCSNVLNVIKEPEVRRNVLENIRRVVKPEGVVYITVYEGSGRGDEGPTKSGYQLNRKTADYLAEIQEVFPDAMRKGKLIIAHPNGSITSSVECATDGTHVPVPYDKYFEIEQPNEDADYMPGDEIEDYDCHFLAYLAPKEKYEDDLSFYPVLTDDPDYPVCELVGGRLYPVGIDDIERMLNIYDDESSTIMSASSISMKAIHDKLLNAASKRMQKSDMGFPLSEIADYLIVDEEETEDGALRIEVRCELDYEGMEKLAEVLDPIVARYDNDAYFDMVAPGIMEAFIFNKKVTADTMTPVESSVFDFPEPPLEPPDYDEPKEHRSIEYIVVDIDDDILVGVDTLDFQSIPKFEGEEVDWVLNEYPNIQIDHSENVMDHVLEVLEPQIPAEPGLYRVRGRVKLAYDVVVYTYYESEGPDDGEYVADEDLTSIDFNYKKSSIENLEVGKD